MEATVARAPLLSDQGAGDEPRKGWAYTLVGYLYVVTSAVLFSINGCLVRMDSKAGFSVRQVTCIIGFVRMLMSCSAIPWRHAWRLGVICLPTGGMPFRLLVLVRQLVGCGALFCMFSSYSSMPLGEATSIVSTAPVWTTLLAFVMLGEPLTVRKFLTAIMACVGVVLIARPPQAQEVTTPEEYPMGRATATTFAVAGSVLLGMTMVLTRKIGDRLPAVVSIGFYGLCLCLCSLVAVFSAGEEILPAGESARSWTLLLIGAVVSYFAQISVTIALQRLPAGPVNVVATSEVAFSCFWQATLLHTPLRFVSVLGAILIVASAAIVVTSTQDSPRPAPSNRDREEARGGHLGPVPAQSLLRT